MKKLGFLLAALLLGSTGWGQNRFDYFGPVNGILKGSSTTYYTSAAIESDVTGLWSGSCSNVTYLRGDGTCATPPGTGGGTVNSVALAAPTVFSVSGSPVTNTGTLTLAFATGQTANEFLATPNGSTGAVGLRVITTADLPAIPLTSGVTGILPTANGGTGEAATFTGVRKANTASADTAAVAADVYGLWSGTCSSSTFLRGDGSCAAPAAGSVTSVGLSWTGSGLTVTGSPVTSSGTIALSGTLNAASGGTGEAGTVTGILKGNGTSAHSAAVAADVYGLWSGTCSSSTFLRGDGSCAATGGSTGANPTALVGLTATNGTATTFMRSDASPALDQSISPTMTSNWTFANASNSITIFKTTTAADVSEIIVEGATGTTAEMGLCSSNTAAACESNEAAGDANLFHTGTLHISTQGGADQLTILAAGNVAIPAPSSGTALTVNGLTATDTIEAVSTGAAGPFNIGYNFGITANQWNVFSQSTDPLTVGTAGAAGLALDTNSAQRLTINSTGNVTVNAPSSGNALTVDVLENNAIELSGANTTRGYQLNFFDSTASAFRGFIGIGVSTVTGAATTDFAISPGTSGSLVIGTANGAAIGTRFGPAGNVTINAPSSGTAAQVNGVANANTLVVSTPNTASQSFGMSVGAGTNSSDYNTLWQTAAGGAIGRIYGDGGFAVGAPTGGDKGSGSINAQSAFVNNSAVCTANGTNCPGSAAFKYAQGAFAITGSSCSITSSVGIASCTWNSAGSVTVFTSAGFTSAGTTLCIASPTGSSFASISNNTAGSSPVNVAVFQFNAAGVAANASFNMFCSGT